MIKEPNVFSLYLKVLKQFGIDLSVIDGYKLAHGKEISFVKKRNGNKSNDHRLLRYDKETGVLRSKEIKMEIDDFNVYKPIKKQTIGKKPNYKVVIL